MRNTTWKEFKEAVERHIRESGIAEDQLEIDYIVYWGDDSLETQTIIALDPNQRIQICKKDEET
jgi:hypothetical protein